MSTSLENNASLPKDNISNNIHRNEQQKLVEGNKNNWANGLVVLNELDTSDDDSSSSSSSSSYTSEVSHSTTQNSAAFSNPPNYFSSQITNNYSTSFSKPTQNQEEPCFYSDSKKPLETSEIAENNSSNSSCNSKLSKSTTTSNFSMEQEDREDRESSTRSDDTDSPVGPPVEKKLLPMPQTSISLSPNYVNIKKDTILSNTLCDENEDQDDIKSGKVIGANLSDEETGNDNSQIRYNRNNRDAHQSR